MIRRFEIIEMSVLCLFLFQATLHPWQHRISNELRDPRKVSKISELFQRLDELPEGRGHPD